MGPASMESTALSVVISRKFSLTRMEWLACKLLLVVVQENGSDGYYENMTHARTLPYIAGAIYEKLLLWWWNGG